MKKNSGKNPAFQFYPNDWFRDLAEHPLEIEGAWIRIICKLWWSENRGKMSLNLKQWSRVLGESEDKTKEIINYLFTEKIADVTKSNSVVTVMNRRMLRDDKLRKDNALRQERYRVSQKSNETSNGEKTETYEDEVEDEVEIEKQNKEKDFAKKVIEYLNLKARKDYKYTTRRTIEIINARVNEGFELEDFKKVIDNKIEDWFGDKEWGRFIRPQTLFSNNFEGYLNQNPVTKHEPPKREEAPDGVPGVDY